MNSTAAIKESDILRIVREDVLRIGERKEKISLEVIKSEVEVSSSFVFKTIRNLEEEKIIQVEDEFIRLTKKGQIEAKDIVKKHQLLEDYFKETRSKKEAHQAANYLEHYVSEVVINNLKKLSTLKKQGVPLTKFQLHTRGKITDISLSDYGLFERIISMGIFLGEEIMLTNEIPHTIIVKIKNKWWMLENLNYTCENSWDYNNDKENGKKWGRLYTWDAAMIACPKGWHVASDDDWQELEKYFGVNSSQLDNLGWREQNIGELLRNENKSLD